MRIITGSARGTHLFTLPGENTRPTSERAKEAIFSTLQFDLGGKTVLDLFSGSGQMGLEAVSRGAELAVLCDASRDAASVIRKNIEKTRLSERCELHCKDASTCLRGLRGKYRFDLVFLDPPYAEGLIPGSLEGLLRNGLLSEGAILVCESAGEGDVFGEKAEKLSRFFKVRKTVRYGIATVTFLIFEGGEEG